VEIDAALVRRLVAAQFPQWADLDVRPVAHGGWDNRTFHLGEDLSVRMPSAGRYAAAVEKEQLWLPRLAPQLSLPIPAPVALGRPGEGYPYPWSVCRWLPGEAADAAPPDDLAGFAGDLAAFLRTFQDADAAGGPPAGRHSFHRGGDLAVYDAQTQEALARLQGRVDTARAQVLWRAALATRWTASPVWVHGDIAPSNLLVAHGRLSAVIDFGQLSVGDPACDYGIAWTMFDAEARTAFRDRLAIDAGTWARARGWTLWKALIIVAGVATTTARQTRLWRGALDAVLNDPEG
jgi:aminoglycoside phosphotransferase (APT) family kinase protein